MPRTIRLLLAGLVLATSGCYLGEPYVDGPPRARVATSMGDFVVELVPELAPATVANFEQYVQEGFYDGTIFHRTVEGFIIQGGGFTANLEQKPTRAPIALESRGGLRNFRSTVAMARTADPNSATSQFFVNLADNSALDPTLEHPGYMVFGIVVEGMEVVDAIALVPTQSSGALENVPVDPIVIASITLEHGEPTLSPDWRVYGEAVEVNFQRYLQSTAFNVLNLFLQRQ